MISDWQKLSAMTGGEEFNVNRITTRKTGISIEGEFSLPPLAQLCYEDQVFVGVFIKVHGSIKEMEQAFGISYPTVKARLNKISRSLGFVETSDVTPKEEVLAMLERGEISADEAVRRLS